MTAANYLASVPLSVQSNGCCIVLPCCPSFMRMFYSCFIELVLTFSCARWFVRLSVQSGERLQGIGVVRSEIAGISLTSPLQGEVLKKCPVNSG